MHGMTINKRFLQPGGWNEGLPGLEEMCPTPTAFDVDLVRFVLANVPFE